MTEKLDERLSEALAGLETAEASPEFTRGVLAAIDSRRKPRPRARLRFAVAAAALIAILAASWWRLGPTPTTSDDELSRRAESLRAQHRLLEAELEELRRQADESLSALELASGEDLDVILDLRPLVFPREARRGRTTTGPIEAVERR